MRKTRKVYLAGLLAGLGTLGTVSLQGGWPVVDIIGNSHLLVQIQKLKDQITWAQQQYETQMNTYRQVMANARFLIDKHRWRSAIESWTHPVYGNASGKTAPWLQGSLDVAKAADAIISVTSRLPNIVDRYGRFGFTGAEIDAIKRKHYAKLEIESGTHEATLAMLAGVRAVQAQRTNTIKTIEDQMLSDLAFENSEAALLGKIGGASMISLRNQQDQLKLAAQMIDLQLQRDIREHNAMVDAAAREAAFLTGHDRDNKRLFKTGTTEVLTAYRGF
jgi:hypothetical protein